MALIPLQLEEGPDSAAGTQPPSNQQANLGSGAVLGPPPAAAASGCLDSPVRGIQMNQSKPLTAFKPRLCSHGEGLSMLAVIPELDKSRRTDAAGDPHLQAGGNSFVHA